MTDDDPGDRPTKRDIRKAIRDLRDDLDEPPAEWLADVPEEIRARGVAADVYAWALQEDEQETAERAYFEMLKEKEAGIEHDPDPSLWPSSFGEDADADANDDDDGAAA